MQISNRGNKWSHHILRILNLPLTSHIKYGKVIQNQKQEPSFDQVPKQEKMFFFKLHVMAI